MNTTATERRIPAGGVTVAFDGHDERIPVCVAEFDLGEIDRRNGWQEPDENEKSTLADLDREEAEFFGIVNVNEWCVAPYSREETIKGRTRTITMRPQLSAYLKTVALRVCLRPQALGFKTPTLECVAEVCGVSKQCLGRILIDLRERFPGFVTQSMHSDTVRELYRSAQLAAREAMPDDFAHPQLSLL